MSDESIKKLINEGHMITFKIYSKWYKRLIMTIYFDNHRPVNIRKSKWEEYWDVLDKAEGV